MLDHTSMHTFKYAIWEITVTALNNITSIIGDDPQQINKYFENWHTHSDSDKLKLVRTLKGQGHLSAQFKVDQTHSFQCPLYNFSLIKPCAIKTCQYHIEVTDKSVEAIAACKNCLINCIDLSKNNRMSAQEASILLGISVSEINTLSINVISKIRRSKIKEHIERYQIPRFKIIKGHCVACERYIQDELEMGIHPDLNIDGSHGWCSPQCKELKPKWQFTIENEFGCHHMYALAAGLLLYKNMDNLHNIFSINKETVNKNKSTIHTSATEIKKYFF